jgi:hypothetical protein
MAALRDDFTNFVTAGTDPDFGGLLVLLASLVCPECELADLLAGGAAELRAGAGAAALTEAADVAGVGLLDAAGAGAAAQLGRAASAAQEAAAESGALANEAAHLADLPDIGLLEITATNPSASEIRAAEEMAGAGSRVTLRDPVGTRAGGGTSDLVVDGVLWDVYSPTGTSINSMLGKIAKKYSQVHGGGVIVDLRGTGLSAADFGGAAEALRRVNGMIKSWGKDELIGEVRFFGG